MISQLLSSKNGYLLGFVSCFATVALALAIQTQYNLEPCPLCISQRIVFMGLGLLFLIAAFIKPKTLLHKIFVLLQILTALGGAGVAIRHWWIQAHHATMVVDCGVGIDYMFQNFPLKKMFMLIFKGSGDCAVIDWSFIGLSLPQLSLITFISFATYAVYLARRKNEKQYIKF